MKLKVCTNYELEINSLDKFDYSPYNIFDNSLKIDEKKYRIEHLINKIPMIYSIIPVKLIAFMRYLTTVNSRSNDSKYS